MVEKTKNEKKKKMKAKNGKWKIISTPLLDIRSYTSNKKIFFFVIPATFNGGVYTLV